MSGIYLHIPYCHSKCHYCDFFSTPQTAGTDDYINALAREYSLRKDEINGDITTVYIGGGTPSMLSPNQIERIFSFLPYDGCREITMEVNPEDMTDDFARFISRSPINRVSMGIQSMNDHELRYIGRRHSATDAVTAYNRLRDAGITNISLDLIYGLPQQTLDSWNETLEKTIELHPDHLSAYSLMLEPGTRLWAKLQAGKIKETNQEISERMYLRLCHIMKNNGFEHYEISNFSQPGYRSLHNSNYWNLTPYLGLGVAAHSFDGTTRRFNPTNLRKYVSTPSTIYETEHLTDTQKINEYLLIRLRTQEGIELSDFSNRFGNVETERLIQRAEHDLQNGMLTLNNGIMAVPESRWLVSDTTLVNLFQS